ncbi:hypothetical protein [Sphingomonas sp.]|uniref:hypothetical protein n=1 Tax=Sphingomonas sp. TaxID=28214 RepID=UPI0035C806DC
MIRSLLATAVAGTVLLSAVASAAPIATTQATAVDERSPRTAVDGSGSPFGGSWIVAVLALLAVAGGIVAASSGDSQPESP